MTTDNTTNTDLYMVDDIQFSEEIEISTTSQIDLNSQMDPCPICLQTPTHPTRLPCSHVNYFNLILNFMINYDCFLVLDILFFMCQRSSITKSTMSVMSSNSVILIF